MHHLTPVEAIPVYTQFKARKLETPLASRLPIVAAMVYLNYIHGYLGRGASVVDAAVAVAGASPTSCRPLKRHLATAREFR